MEEGWDMKLYIEKLEQAKKIAENQKSKGVMLSTDNIVAIATTMFISAERKMSKGGY